MRVGGDHAVGVQDVVEDGEAGGELLLARASQPRVGLGRRQPSAAASMTVARAVATGTGVGLGLGLARPAAPPAQPPALDRSERAQHDHVRRVTGAVAHDVATVRRPEGPRELQLAEAEQAGALAGCPEP